MLNDRSQSVAQGSYKGVIKKLSRIMHKTLLILMEEKGDLKDSERTSLFFDTLYSLLMVNVMQSGVKEERVHEMVTWFYKNNKELRGITNEAN